jgi:NAD(P)-dependent dehydrogenase (short-subunit alcohol dehydrogenase family)
MAEQAPVALIGGVTGGIGQAVLARLARSGWRVAGYARSAGKLEELRADGPVVTTVADATSAEQVERAVGAATDAYGRVDAYVHAIGSLLLKPAHLTTPEELRAAIEVNLISAFLALRGVLGPMRAQRSGSVVLVSSVAAVAGLANHEAIAAAKGGINGLVLSAAATYATAGIRVNAVAPGTVETGLTARLLGSPSGRKVTESMHPLGRVGTPDDVAALVAWLVSAEAGWVTGQVWSADGGMGALLPHPARR